MIDEVDALTLPDYMRTHAMIVLLTIASETFLMALLIQQIISLFSCKAPLRRIALVSLIVGMAQTVPLFVFDRFIEPRPMNVWQHGPLFFANPLLVPVVYALLKSYLLIPTNRCAPIAQKVMCYSNLSNIVFQIAQEVMLRGDGGLDAYIDAGYGALLISTVCSSGLILLLGAFVEWRNLGIPLMPGMGRKRFALLRAFGETTAVSAFLVFYRVTYAYPPAEMAGAGASDRVRFVSYGFLVVIGVTYFLLDLYREMLQVKRYELTAMKAHIAALGDANEQFRGIKHDINNMLQIYDGYIAMNNMEKLRSYHNAVLHTTRSASTHIDLCRTLDEYPPVYSLIVAAEEKAERLGVDLSVTSNKVRPGLPISDVDLCRILGILLDNALEASVASAKKRMTVSIEARTEGVLFIVANSSDGEFNASQIYNKGYTTKEGTERGFGLYEVQKIVKKNGLCTLHANRYEDTVTFYLNVEYAHAQVG